MGTTVEPPRPVLVDRKTRRKKITAQPKTTPESAPSQPLESTEAANLPAAADIGEPDHSLVPTPPKRLLEPAEFFRFWRSIPKRERDAWFIVYPYRKLPVCDPLQPLTLDELRAIERKQKKKPESNCGKLAEPFDPENWEQQVYQWKGAGDYHFRLNDTHPSVKGTICETSIRGLRDWDNFPPILELNEVVLEEPLNQPYLRWARLRGIKFPGDPGSIETPDVQQEQEDMANVAAVEKLTDALVDATRQRPQVVPAPSAGADAAAEAVRATTAAFKDTSKALVEMVTDANKAKAKAEDPMEFHNRVMETAKALQPPAASSGPSLTDIMGLVNSMMAPMIASQNAILAEVRSRAEAAERRAEAAETRAATIQHPPAAAPESPVKAALELIKGLATLKEAAGPILGEAAEAAPGSVWERLAEKAIDAAPSFMHNLAVLKTGQGTPQAPPELQVSDDEPEAAPETPQLNAQENEEMFSKARIAQAIAAPLIESLNRGDRGFQFAAGMILQPNIMGFPGAAVYEMALNAGKDGMIQILQAYPELWQKLVTIPKKLDAFIDDFLNADMARAIVAESKKPQAPEPPAQEVTPEVLPKPNGAPRTGGRTIIGPGGQTIQTA